MIIFTHFGCVKRLKLVKEKSSESGLKVDDPFGSAKQARFSNAKCLLLAESAGHSRYIVGMYHRIRTHDGYFPNTFRPIHTIFGLVLKNKVFCRKNK